MDDEFKLCWKNFQDNIASGFQSLYDRGDLVDVTLACDGKLLQAHKIVLAICSPYFQEIFISNPCKHPIIILKDVTYNIMCELLEFMYQGVVNVKHTELQAFMKIGQLLQIKGLATNSSSSAASTSSDKSSNYNHSNKENDVETSFTTKTVVASASETAKNGESSNNVEKPTLGNSNPNTPQRSQSPALSPASPANAPLNVSTINQAPKPQDSQLSGHHPYLQSVTGGSSGIKRHSDYSSDSLSIFSRNKLRRSLASTDRSSENNDGPDGSGVGGGMDQMNTEDFFLPHISMVESRYDMHNIKRESAEHHLNPDAASAAAVAAAASASLRNSFSSTAFGLDYTFYKNNNVPAQSSQEYPNDLHMSSEYSKSFANHMEIPPNCPNVVMLSSTSLLHGSCVFNRNNTVATQQGMKTYWLCKSYRISMCRARCITHQGKIISATGVHNHAPHMRGNNTGGSGVGGGAIGIAAVSGANSGNNGSNNNNSGPPNSSQPGSNSGGGANVHGFRYPPPNTGSIGNNGNNHQNFHDQHNSRSSPPPQMYATHSQMHAGNSGQSNMPPSHHHYMQSMPNLVVQHHPGSQTTQQMQEPSSNLTLSATHNSSVVQHMMHSTGILHSPQTISNFDLSPTMQSSPSEHSTFDPNEKTLNSLNKDHHHINDDHIPVHNAALSPTVMHNNSSIKSGPTNAQTHDNEIITKMSSSEHQQAQIIDSIEISPSCGHNFKLESM